MSKMIRLTNFFEYPGVEVTAKDYDSLVYVCDDRLNVAVPAAVVTQENMIPLYKAYVKHFCAELNQSRGSRIKYLAECGFLPIGVEPNMFAGQINTRYLIPNLRRHAIPYFQMAPSSPVSMIFQSFTASTETRDIWVNKIDAAKVVKKPIHNITASDLLEVLLNDIA